jgi:hypothetical protein
MHISIFVFLVCWRIIIIFHPWKIHLSNSNWGSTSWFRKWSQPRLRSVQKSILGYLTVGYRPQSILAIHLSFSIFLFTQLKHVTNPPWLPAVQFNPFFLPSKVSLPICHRCSFLHFPPFFLVKGISLAPIRCIWLFCISIYIMTLDTVYADLTTHFYSGAPPLNFFGCVKHNNGENLSIPICKRGYDRNFSVGPPSI